MVELATETRGDTSVTTVPGASHPTTGRTASGRATSATTSPGVATSIVVSSEYRVQTTDLIYSPCWIGLFAINVRNNYFFRPECWNNVEKYRWCSSTGNGLLFISLQSYNHCDIPRPRLKACKAVTPGSVTSHLQRWVQSTFLLLDTTLP